MLRRAVLVLLMFSLNRSAWAESAPTAPPATAAETAAPAAQTTTEPPPAPAPAPPVAARDAAETRLAQSLRDGSRIDWWGPTEQAYLVLWREQSTARPFGTLVLLHSQGHNADWPGVIRQLRSALPGQGWSSASVSMPLIKEGLESKDNAKQAPSPAPEQTQPKPEENAMPTAATEPTPTQTAAPVAAPEAQPEAQKPADALSGEQRIADTLSHLNTQSGAKVLLAYHLAAEPLLRAARDGKLQGYSALILIEPAFLTTDPAEQKLLHEELALLPLATLDISAEHGDQKNARFRQAMAKRAARKDYVQWQAPGARVDFSATLISLERRVRGWLHKEFELPPPAQIK